MGIEVIELELVSVPSVAGNAPPVAAFAAVPTKNEPWFNTAGKLESSVKLRAVALVLSAVQANRK